MADVKRVSSKPVKYVFDTYHRGDHSYGNAVWDGRWRHHAGVSRRRRRDETQRSSPLAADRQTAQGRSRHEPPQRRAAQADFRRQLVRAGRWRAQGGVPFLRLGAHPRRRLRYRPKEQVLCMGDAVVNGRHNCTKESRYSISPTGLHGCTGDTPSVFGIDRKLLAAQKVWKILDI